MRPISELANIHAGETFSIVAVGPSILNLSATDLVGPVIALYDAVTFVEALDPTNPVYAMQKDGCGRGYAHCPDCSKAAPGMVRPSKAPLLLHSQESAAYNCFADYPDRYVFDTITDLGFDHWWEPSGPCAVRLARYMGAAKVIFVAFDSCTNGDCRRVEARDGRMVVVPASPQEEGCYPLHCEYMRGEIADIPTQWVRPE